MARIGKSRLVRLGAATLVTAALFVILFTREWIVEVRLAEGNARILCEPVERDQEIVYSSINSIFNDPVDESWSIRSDGSFQVTRVTTSPAVMGYYGIPTFEPTEGSMVRATPSQSGYREIRMLVDGRGQARLAVNGREYTLYRMVPDATVVIIHARPAPRYIGCW